MESNIKVTFWLRASKKTTLKQVPIYLRVWYNYDHFTMTTGLTTKASEWDKKSMKVRGNSEEANSINSQLDGIRVKILQIINQLTISGKPFNIHNIKKTLDGNDSNQITLLRLMEEHLKEMRKLKGKEYEQATIIKYTNTKLRLQQFIKFFYKRSDLYIYELNSTGE